MMDDERYRREYNNVRDVCLCRDRSISQKVYDKTDRSISQEVYDSCKTVIGRDCKPDKYLECPLFVFIKKVSCTMHNRW